MNFHSIICFPNISLHVPKTSFFNGNSLYFLAQMIPLVTNTIPSKMVDNSSNVSYCDVVGQTQLSSNPSYVILLWCIVSFIFVAFLCIFGLIYYYTFLSRHLPRAFLYFLQIFVFANMQTWETKNGIILLNILHIERIDK